MRYFLISCVSGEKATPCRAIDLYDSTWFRYARSYVEARKPDGIFVLSAKYGLVEANTVIAPYELTLNTMSDIEIRDWAECVLVSLHEQTDIRNDLFVILAGLKYRKYLIPHLVKFEIPMEGLPIGKQLAWLKAHCKS